MHHGTTTRCRCGLSDLPNELLYEIIKYLDVGHPAHVVFNVFNVLPRVSRKLRDVTHDYWQRRHTFFHNRSGLVREMLKNEPEFRLDLCFRDLKKIKRLAIPWAMDSVRTIQIGHVPYPQTLNGYLPGLRRHRVYMPSTFLQMPKLKSWLVYDAVEAPLGVIALAEHLPQLEHLGMLWQSDHVVPDVDLFPVLETLRIIVNVEYFSRKNWAQTDFGSGVRSVAITSLAIHELTDDSNVLGSFCDGTKYTFPNLRVVHFSQARVVVPKIYDFVRRHSTLLEVNISFAQWAIKSLRLEALLKLIHGTGRWVRPADQPWVVLDQPSFDEYVVDGAVPPDLAYNWGAFYDFAFSRAPIPDVDGPEEPRYTCTALAIRFLDKDDDYERTAQLPAGAEYFIDPKEGPCNLLPELQELRLSVTDEQDTGSTFRETMLYRSGSIPSYLKAWPKLRKLALHWPFRDAYWECPHWEHRHEEVPFVCAPCDSVKIPFLDWLAPHIRENPPR